MSSFVLNRNYQLQLPNSFVEIDREEMEYVDGGYNYTERWYGFDCDLSAQECADMSDELTQNAIVYGGEKAGIAAVMACFGPVGQAVGLYYGIKGIIGSGNGAYVASRLNTASRRSGATLIKQGGVYKVNIW